MFFYKSKKPKIAIISMTYNRSDYIERSFNSLKKRLNTPFDLYVIDDCSNEKTRDALKSREDDFKKLIFREKRFGLMQNFNKALEEIPSDYDYYVKLDSDIEILSDNLLKECKEIAKFPKFGCVVPRIEGIKSLWDSSLVSKLHFFNGHAIRFLNSPPGGGFMFFNKVIKNFRTKDTNYGLDTQLSKFISESGLKIIYSEDLSVYHIDNFFGQRKKYRDYFKKRGRWSNYDKTGLDFLSLSKEIGEEFLTRDEMQYLYKKANDWEEFREMTSEFIKQGGNSRDLKDDLGSEEIKSKVLKNRFKIISPLNFPADRNIEHGEEKIVDKIPDWAKNNPHVVIEPIKVSEFKKTIKLKRFPCKTCGKIFDTEKGLNIHKGRVHGQI